MAQLIEHQLFITSCYVTYLVDIDNLKISEQALYHESNSTNNERSNKGGFQTTPIFGHEIDSPEVLKLFQKHICPAAQKVADSWNLIKDMDAYSFWYNVNRRYNYNTAHTHPHSFISGVYYSKVPSNSGLITFDRAQSEIDRLQFQQTHILSTGVTPDNSRINTEHWFTPTEGMLILFPGHLSHAVDQNLTQDHDDARVSLSFNFF
jgi:uncharacterized protein (TIGR02466 family)